jgi:hypothetical protein
VEVSGAESPREAIGAFFGQSVRGKGVRVRDIRAVLGHRDKVSCR